jgi:hypothetical protein
MLVLAVRSCFYCQRVANQGESHDLLLLSAHQHTSAVPLTVPALLMLPLGTCHCLAAVRLKQSNWSTPTSGAQQSR